MSDVPESADVVVIGGGPGGHAAALSARNRGASVVLVERELLGGQCVHHTCIPNALLLGAVGQYLDAQELALAGVFDLGDAFRLGRAVSRREALVATLAAGLERSLRSAGVTVARGGGSLASPGVVSIDGGSAVVRAGAVVIASGARWEPPKVEGVPNGLVVTLDEVTRLTSAPRRAVVLGGGPAATAFALEAAVVLAAAGTSVVLALPGPQVVPAMDADIDGVLRANLEAIGITVVPSASTGGAEDGGIVLTDDGATAAVEADIVVAPDARRPNLEGLGLDSFGVDVTTWLTVDGACRSAVPEVYAVGDVTGGAMLTAAASHMGRVAGTNAAGGSARTRLGDIPHVLHTSPPAAWIGRSESAAAAEGYDVTSAIVDLGVAARSVTLGGREGYLKLVAERELGEVLGVQVVGAEAPEIIAVVAQAMAAGLTVDDLAETVQWHPSAAESVAEAARDIVTATLVPAR